MTGCRRIVVVLTLAAILVLTVQGMVWAEPDQSRTYLGIRQQESSGGIAITAVEANSPAARAGLRAGDIILSLNGIAVRSSQELQSAARTMTPYTPAALVISRGGAVLHITVLPTGILRLAVTDMPAHPFVIPGVPDSVPPAPSSAVEAMDQINVLRQVIIDPATGRLELVGAYDSRYATGPIPYLDLLKTALQYPAPGLSLNLRPETMAVYQELRNRDASPISASNLATKALLLLYGHPGLERERQGLIRAYAEQFSITPQEYAAMYNFFTLDNQTGAVPPDIARIQERIFRHLDYSVLADAYAIISGGSADGAVRALQLLGRTPGEYPGSPAVQAYFAMQEQLNGKPVQWAMDRRADVERQNQNELLIRLQRQMLPEWDRSRQKNVNVNVLTKLILSNEASMILGDIPQGVESEIYGKDIDTSSQLCRILYEADYAMKSRQVFPQLFTSLPGAVTPYEYMAMTATGDRFEAFNRPVRYWLEPRKVEMEFSPDKRVVTFGSADIRMLAHVLEKDTMQDDDFTAERAADVNWDAWCDQLSDNYDAYAAIVPSFHKLREAAKVIALARWLRAENMAVDLAGVAQEKWTPPSRVPGFWVYGFTLQLLDGNATKLRAWRYNATGGVVFKPKSNWTQYTPSTTSETKVSNQLVLSASLGQKAVQAAKTGHLENAKYLAELSAQAMNGSLTKQDLAKLNIPVPEAKMTPVAPANVQLQKEMVKKTYQQLGGSGKTPPGGSPTLTFDQLDSLYDQVKNNPAAASDYLKQLQTGQLPAPPQNKPPVVQPPAAKPAAPVCGETSLGAEMLPAERKAYLTAKLQDARQRLTYINEALRKLIDLDAANRAEIDRLTDEITAEYEAARERAYDFVVTTLVDLPLAQYADIHETRLKAMRQEIGTLMGKSKNPLTADELAALQKEIALKTSLADNYEEAFKSTGRLLDLYAGANYAKDITSWEQETRYAGDRKRLLEAAKLTGTILLDHPKLNDFLSKKDWFGGNKLWQVVAMGKMAAYASDFFWDVMNLYGAWSPMAARMQDDLRNNVQNMELMRQKAQATMAEIDCLERLVK